jgi:hypothetical protein
MPIDMKALARAGAEARIRELLLEIDEIRNAFPGLKAPTAVRTRGRDVARAVNLKPSKRKKRKPMSAAQKKAVGIRMKKYWSERRKSEQKG